MHPQDVIKTLPKKAINYAESRLSHSSQPLDKIQSDISVAPKVSEKDNTPKTYGKWQLSENKGVAIKSKNEVTLNTYENCHDTIKNIIQNQEFRKDSKAIPCLRKPPLMPKGLRKTEHCIIKHDITENGSNSNIKIIYCTDNRLEAPSIAAAIEWLYYPKIHNGKTVLQTNETTKITYRLRNQHGVIVYE